MESERSSSSGGENKKEYLALLEKGEEDEENDHEVLKRRISNHPLYELLVEQHLKCLKVGDISNLDRVQKKKDKKKQAMKEQNLGMFSQSELDHFMEAYCMELGKLKEAMEEPQLNSMAFINNMYSQLRDLTGITLPPPSPESSSPHCNFQTQP